jgi:hypothetical protein
MVLLIQLHHCLGFLPTPHGVDDIEVKQIAKQNLCLWILSPTFHVLLHVYVIHF